MDHRAKPAPAPIRASVTLPRLLLKNDPGVARAAAPPWLRWQAASGWPGTGGSVSPCPRWEQAGHHRLAATHGATAVPSVSAIVSAPAAARVINRLTCTPPPSVGENLSGPGVICAHQQSRYLKRPSRLMTVSLMLKYLAVNSDLPSRAESCISEQRIQRIESRVEEEALGSVPTATTGTAETVPQAPRDRRGDRRGGAQHNGDPVAAASLDRVKRRSTLGYLPSGVDRTALNLVVITLDTTRADRLGRLRSSQRRYAESGCARDEGRRSITPAPRRR